jgi:hypothetical protein
VAKRAIMSGDRDEPDDDTLQSSPPGPTVPADLVNALGAGTVAAPAHPLVRAA